MSGEMEPGKTPKQGQGERSSYLTIAVVFLVSCGLAAAGVALHDAGGLGVLFGPRLETFDPKAVDPGASGAPSDPEDAPPPQRRSRKRTMGAGPRSSLPAPTPKPTPGSEPAGALGEGRLLVRCNRPCRVTVDGEILGEASPLLRLHQPAGEHLVRVELLDGNDLAVRRVLVAPGRDRKIAFTLGVGAVPGKDPLKDPFQDLSGTEEWEQ